MEKKNVNCPFCGYEKQIGADCPKCGRGGVILKVEDVVAGCRYHKPLSEHDSFDSAYEAACKLFDDGVWDDFLIDEGRPPDVASGLSAGERDLPEVRQGDAPVRDVRHP